MPGVDDLDIYSLLITTIANFGREYKNILINMDYHKIEISRKCGFPRENNKIYDKRHL